MEGTAKDVLARWIVRLLLVPWERLREPKVMHALISTAYLSAAVAGTAVICDGAWWTGGLLLFGGLLPLGSMHGGHWGLERAGLILLMGGFVGWLAGLPEQSATVGELAARAALTFGVVALMAARWYRIRGLDMDPDR